MTSVLTDPNKAAEAARETVLASGRSRDNTPGSLVFLGALWFSLFFGVVLLLLLLVTTAVGGADRFDKELLTNFYSGVRPETTGIRAGVLGSM